MALTYGSRDGGLYETVDEKGKLFGKLNIVDLLVIIVIVAAAVLLAFKLLGGSGGVGAAVPQVTYTVRVMEVDRPLTTACVSMWTAPPASRTS